LFDNWESQLKLRNTFHFAEERLKPYVGQLSRDHSYVELTQPEYDEILQTQLEMHVISRCAQLVELGFNDNHRICKAAYVYQLASRRFLFFCVGMDNGLKTIYVTPQFKHRTQYQGLRYLTLDEAENLISK
jgi:hypothetical protein